ncbi:hypothetical protein JQ633_21475 [Bradyrhizobium tropiciagri]|nr:hypothetical protein [Bradyrhizobium tropiciagri]
MFAAAALVASAFVTPVMAQQSIGTPARCSNSYPDRNCQTMRPAAAGTTVEQRTSRRDRDWQGSYNRYDGPVGAAAGVVGGAVGTAAAIATAPLAATEAPIGGTEYARRNGFVCTPGTWFRGSDGLQHPCQ